MTRAAVPRRRERGFMISHIPEDSRKKLEHYSERSKERAMEQAIYQRCGPGGSLADSAIWGQLIAYQVPLFDNGGRDGWGHIDLLGLDAKGQAVVVELKRAKSTETPLRCLMEGVANAIAVTENWHEIRTEIAAIARKKNPEHPVAETADVITIVVLAPSAYWEAWTPLGNPGKAVSLRTRELFWRVCDASAACGFPVVLAEFDWPFEKDPAARLARTSFARHGVTRQIPPTQ